MPKPKYQHDCNTCIFLGQTLGECYRVDLYFHPPFDKREKGTVIARFSDEGSDYASCPIQHARPEGHAEVWAAKSVAEKFLKS